MGKFVFLFPYQFFKYQLVFTNFILVNTNSLFYPRQYTRFNKDKSHKKIALWQDRDPCQKAIHFFETSPQ